MKTLSVREISDALHVTPTFDGVVRDVSIDNRAVTPDSLFVCIRGERFDGHDFAWSALENGASAVLCERDLGLEKQIVVPDTRRALLELAAYYRGLFDIPLAAVTGSVGKTTVKEMISFVLEGAFRTQKTLANRNNELGMPLTAFSVTESHEMAVFEMGMRGFGQIA